METGLPFRFKLLTVFALLGFVGDFCQIKIVLTYIHFNVTTSKLLRKSQGLLSWE